MEDEITEETIHHVSNSAASEWKKLAFKLPIAKNITQSKVAVDALVVQHPGNIKDQCYWMLIQWVTEQENTTAERLVECLRSLNQNKVASELEKMRETTTEDNSVRATAQVTPSIPKHPTTWPEVKVTGKALVSIDAKIQESSSDEENTYEALVSTDAKIQEKSSDEENTYERLILSGVKTPETTSDEEKGATCNQNMPRPRKKFSSSTLPREAKQYSKRNSICK